jgi:Kdo2-lipid IVA lauroyltransferase/acyltransferase
MSASPLPEASGRAALALRILALAPLGLFRAAGWVMAVVLLLLAPRRRRVVWRNLALCFPQVSVLQRGCWTWQTFLHFSQSFLDRVWLWHGPAERVSQRVRLRDPHGVMASGQPLVCFAPHFYGLDAAWTGLTLGVARPWMTLYADQVNPRMDRWIQQGRLRFGHATLVSRRLGVRPVLKGLKEGASLYLLPDMDLGEQGAVFVPFFGIPTATVTSLSRFARLAQRPVVSVTARMVADGYEVEVGPVWSAFPGDNDEADTQRMNAELERHVHRMPGQYHWLHRRFKTRPAGEPPLYRD